MFGDLFYLTPVLSVFSFLEFRFHVREVLLIVQYNEILTHVPNSM